MESRSLEAVRPSVRMIETNESNRVKHEVVE